jgi:hypothetical protein
MTLPFQSKLRLFFIILAFVFLFNCILLAKIGSAELKNKHSNDGGEKSIVDFDRKSVEIQNTVNVDSTNDLKSKTGQHQQQQQNDFVYFNENLLLNPSFETLGGRVYALNADEKINSFAAHWESFLNPYRIDEEEFHSGDRSLRINTVDLGKLEREEL